MTFNLIEIVDPFNWWRPAQLLTDFHTSENEADGFSLPVLKRHGGCTKAQRAAQEGFG